MRTTVKITGELGGNRKLLNRIQSIDSTVEEYRFNNYGVIFNTKKEAVKALSKAYQSLKYEEPNYFKNGGMQYLRGYGLYYDASKAVIIDDRN